MKITLKNLSQGTERTFNSVEQARQYIGARDSYRLVIDADAESLKERVARYVIIAGLLYFGVLGYILATI